MEKIVEITLISIPFLVLTSFAGLHFGLLTPKFDSVDKSIKTWKNSKGVRVMVSILVTIALATLVSFII